MKKNYLHRLFQGGVIVKAFDGLVETIAGILLFLVSSATITNLIQSLFKHELAHDPTDFIATLLIGASQHASARIVSAVYLITHGVLKLGLATALWQERLRTYRIAAVILVLLLILETVRLVMHFSPILFTFAVIDAVILGFVWWEYQRLTAAQ